MLIVTDVSCKRRKVNIRDQFKKSLNRRKTKSGQAAESNAKRYKHEEVLQILMPRIQERSTISSIQQPSENDSDMVNSQVMAPTDDETREEISASNRNADIHQPANPR
jgi:ATP-dependent protease HslVU (ClpYQ) ATPase subunit